MTGVSGGAWAALAYTFANNASVPDETLLGPITDPANLTKAGLAQMDDACLCSGPVRRDLNAELLKAIQRLSNGSDAEAWHEAVRSVFMAPFNITDDIGVAPSAAWAANARARNPSLGPLLTPRVDRPFPITTATLLCPVAAAPLARKDRNFTALEMTPLYGGQPYTQQLTYMRQGGQLNVTRTLGGFIESFAFGAYPQDAAPGSIPAPQQQLVFARPARNMTLTAPRMASMSSYAESYDIAKLPPPIFKHLLPQVPLYSPASGTLGPVLTSDGGNVMYFDVFSLVLVCR